MKTLRTIKLRSALRAMLLAAVLWVYIPARAADNASTSPTFPTSTTSPAALQETGKPGPGGGDSQGSDRKWLSDFGKRAFPLAIILVVFCWLGFSTWCDYRNRHALLTLHHQERMAALEKGLELPPYPDDGSHAEELAALQPDKPGRPLLIGLVWLFIGIGLAVMLVGINQPNFSPAIGALPAGIGLAYLIYHFAEGRKSP